MTWVGEALRPVASPAIPFPNQEIKRTANVKSVGYARLFNFVLLGVAAAVASLMVGCSGYGSSAASCGGIYNPCPTSTPTPAPTDCSHMVTGSVTVQLKLSFPSCNDTTYGLIMGISDTNSQSNIIKVNTSQTIQFTNVDAVYNFQVDNLGPGTTFPASDMVVNTGSAAGTDISTTNFSTGTINHGTSSAFFHTPSSAGMWVFGERTYYGSGMRTIIIAL
jgi:hypothetical protein